MNENEIIRKNLKKFFDEENNRKRKIAILPLRQLSGVVRNILDSEYGISEQFVVDNYAYDMKNIYPIDLMPREYKECVFLLAASGKTKNVLRRELLAYVSEDQIIDVLFDEERERVFQSESKVHINFVCPGFAKCGTTSLHYALMQNPKIFLPKVKETFFLRYAINETTHKEFKKYFKEAENKNLIKGMIEPSYRCHAEDVYRYCGSDLKLIFCVKNPVDALYSYFKASMRDALEGADSNIEKSLDDFGQVCPEMFDKWAIEYRHRTEYANDIKSFLETYPMEQIKIIIGEELYADTYNQMDGLQDFLGIPEKDKHEYRSFPRENVGSRVIKDKIGLNINRQLNELSVCLTSKGDSQSLGLLSDIRNKVSQITMIDYTKPMLVSTRRNLLDYYMNSIKELEKIIGKSLHGVWYS